MVWSLGAAMNVEKVEALLVDADAENASRVDFTPALSRDATIGVILAALWAYGCRSSDTSAAYAYEQLYAQLGVDVWKSKLERLPEMPA